eukprot:scaffold122904_cov62-Attheya_sp.AAC.4
MSDCGRTHPRQQRRRFARRATSVAGCPGKATSRANIRAHFMHRQHDKDKLIILDEGTFPHPRGCEHCNMFVPRLEVYTFHPNTAVICKDGADWKRQCQARREESRQAMEQVLVARGVPLDTVHFFKYLGRLLSNMDEDWPAVHANLCKAPKSWAMISCILARDGATPRVSGMSYKAVVQSILLFGSETWTHEWIYPPILEKALEEVGLWPIKKYIKKCQNTVAAYVATRPIFELCTKAEWPTGSQSSQRWWDQVDRDFKGKIEEAVVN